jgi:sensor domain CHASE-containing protein
MVVMLSPMEVLLVQHNLPTMVAMVVLVIQALVQFLATTAAVVRLDKVEQVEY